MVWDPANTTSPLFTAAPGTPSYLFPLRGGHVVVAPDLADSVTLLDASTLAPLGPPLSPGVGSQHGATLPTTFAASYDDSRRIAVVNRDGVLQMYDVARRAPVGAPLALGMPSDYAVFSRDLRTIAVAGREGEVAIVDVSGRSPRLVHRTLASPMRSYVIGLAFGPHGELYAADPGHLVRFDAVLTHTPQTRDLSKLVRGGSLVAIGMDLSPDGRTLAVSRNGSVELVDTKTLRRRGGGIPATHAPIAWLAFSRDGHHVVVNDDAANVRLVDVSAHRAIGPLWTGLTGAGAVFDHTGRHVGTSTTTSGALLDVGTREWRRDACALAGRNLTVEEWHRYLPGEGPRRRTCPQYG
jgi:hypothetical protein